MVQCCLNGKLELVTHVRVGVNRHVERYAGRIASVRQNLEPFSLPAQISTHLIILG